MSTRPSPVKSISPGFASTRAFTMPSTLCKSVSSSDTSGLSTVTRVCSLPPPLPSPGSERDASAYWNSTNEQRLQQRKRKFKTGPGRCQRKADRPPRVPDADIASATAIPAAPAARGHPGASHQSPALRPKAPTGPLTAPILERQHCYPPESPPGQRNNTATFPSSPPFKSNAFLTIVLPPSPVGLPPAPVSSRASDSASVY